jgi:hypothetical protein
MNNTNNLNIYIKNARVHIDGLWTHIHVNSEDMTEIPNIRGQMAMLCADSPFAFYSMRYELTDKITLYVKG